MDGLVALIQERDVKGFRKVVTQIVSRGELNDFAVGHQRVSCIGIQTTWELVPLSSSEHHHWKSIMLCDYLSGNLKVFLNLCEGFLMRSKDVVTLNPEKLSASEKWTRFQRWSLYSFLTW